MYAKFLGAFYDADTKQPLPVAVDGDARGEWVLRVNQPLRKAQPVARQVFVHVSEDGGDARQQLVTALIILAAFQSRSCAVLPNPA